MPIKSSRHELMEFLGLIGIGNFMGGSCLPLTPSQIVEYLAYLENVRYLEPRRNIPKSIHWLETVLPNFDDKRFRGHIRMDKQTFLNLAEILRGSLQFNTHQEPIPLQLPVALNRLGTCGNASSTEMIATKFGISHGTVDNFTTRIIQTLNDISENWIKWPTALQRKMIGNAMLNNLLPKCVGFVDGSDVPFTKAPMDSKETYWSRKKRYCIQFQVICDPNRQIRHFFTGYPRSVHDAKVFAATDVNLRPRQYFSEGEYLIGDAAYAKSENMVVPYKRRQGYLTPDQTKFNKHISSYRVIVEHTIGILKGRFQSLKDIRIQIDRDGHIKCCKWIKACVVLHNMLMQIDPWTREEDEVILDPVDEDDDTEYPPVNPNEAGELKRTALSTIINAMN